MKQFTKRLALVTGLLFTALICMAAVFIDTTSVFWKTEGGVVKLYVSNSIAVVTVQTNGQSIGIFSTNTLFAFDVTPKTPSTNSNATGQSSQNSGAINLQGARGGDTMRLTTGTGGQGGAVLILAGMGGEDPVALTNNTGGAGGAVTFFSGDGGGASASAATNNILGGNGGSGGFGTGNGGSPSSPATNTIGGVGGNFQITAGNGGTPTAGWSRKGGNGGPAGMVAGNGGDGVRTNGGIGGSLTMTAGNGGAATTSPGNPSPGGSVNITAGAGATGPSTNSDGGHVLINGGAPGSGAVPGNVKLASLGRGAGVQIGPATATIATITNALAASLALDFPSTATLASSDLPIAIAGVTSNNCAVALSVAWEGAAGGGIFSTFASNDTVFVRFSNNTALSIDPTLFTATVVCFRIR